MGIVSKKTNTFSIRWQNCVSELARLKARLWTVVNPPSQGHLTCFLPASFSLEGFDLSVFLASNTYYFLWAHRTRFLIYKTGTLDQRGLLWGLPMKGKCQVQRLAPISYSAKRSSQGGMACEGSPFSNELWDSCTREAEVKGPPKSRLGILV